MNPFNDDFSISDLSVYSSVQIDANIGELSYIYTRRENYDEFQS